MTTPTLVKKQFKVLGHQVDYNVTASSGDFNLLDPKRTDAANDEAVNNIVYRVMNPDTRYWFLHGRDAVAAKDGVAAVEAIVGVEEQLKEMFSDVTYDADDTSKKLTIERETAPAIGKDGKPRVSGGEPVTTFQESEEVYYKRALAMSVKYKKFASVDAARAHFDPLIKQIAAEVAFDVTAAERGERGPKKLAVKYKNTAARIIANGTVAAANSNYLSKIGKTFAETKDNTKLFKHTWEVLDAAKKPTGESKTVEVSDADAEALGWLLKEYNDWKAAQEMEGMVG